jgi:biotin transporter BioY
VVYFIAASMGMVGFYSTFIYVVLGTLGLPIFANGGGIGYIFSPTFGFLYGMVVAAFFISFIFNKEVSTNLIKLSLTIFIGALIIFLCGLSHLSFFIGFEQAVTVGLIPFLYSEFLKILLAIAIIFGLIQRVNSKNQK